MAAEQQAGTLSPGLEGRATAGRYQRTAKSLRRFVQRKPLGAFGAVIVLILIFVAVFANVLAPYGPNLHDVARPLDGPSLSHPAGTDQYGRDMFSRLIFGARISIYVGVGATILSIIPAMFIGITSAYFKGPYDYILQRGVDAIQALPGLILLIALVAILGSGLFQIIFALSFGRAFSNSRILRGASFQIMSMDYVDAARSLGAGNARIMFRHILPNVLAPVIVVGSLGFGQIIIAEASLSFLGFGVAPPAATWGSMLSGEARTYMYAAPHMLWMPAITLGLVVFAVNMFGDALRDVLDPRLRGR